MSGPAFIMPLALLLGLTALSAFLWSLRNGQHHDIEGAAVRIVDEDDVGRDSGGARR